MAELTRIQLGQTFSEWRENLNSNFDSLNEDKVSKEAGKGLSTNDFTTAEKTKLAGIATGAQVNVIETIQLNGTAKTVVDKTVNITFADLQAFMNKLSLGLDSATGKISLSYNGTKITNSEVDTALELIVNGGRYDATTKNIVLTLANGSQINIPAASLVDEYYADGVTVELVVIDGKQTFQVSDALRAALNAAGEQITALQTRMTTAETNITNVQTAITALQNKVVVPEQITIRSSDWGDSSNGVYIWQKGIEAQTSDGTYYQRHILGVYKKVSGAPPKQVICNVSYSSASTSRPVDKDGQHIQEVCVKSEEAFDGYILVM